MQFAQVITEVIDYIIIGPNVKIIEGYRLANFKVASLTSFDTIKTKNPQIVGLRPPMCLQIL